ncbi:hypothetical protein JAAARDRAFT_52236 [Jaapia argillacea MUCL 33604]|uniref:Transmembrane protein n=1 Tax=Jaapia argillacea MUCL 33604 TaxID=933084 RepID=A0A067QL63_9AGAM|nr:hypothetical protein JAAARDRAFT_52236 [Jaapia argillacea MUCL 33604]
MVDPLAYPFPSANATSTSNTTVSGVTYVVANDDGPLLLHASAATAFISLQLAAMLVFAAYSVVRNYSANKAAVKLLHRASHITLGISGFWYIVYYLGEAICKFSYPTSPQPNDIRHYAAIADACNMVYNIASCTLIYACFVMISQEARLNLFLRDPPGLLWKRRSMTSGVATLFLLGSLPFFISLGGSLTHTGHTHTLQTAATYTFMISVAFRIIVQAWLLYLAWSARLMGVTIPRQWPFYIAPLLFASSVITAVFAGILVQNTIAQETATRYELAWHITQGVAEFISFYLALKLCE